VARTRYVPVKCSPLIWRKALLELDRPGSTIVCIT
jgi:hypothetical protein